LFPFTFPFIIIKSSAFIKIINQLSDGEKDSIIKNISDKIDNNYSLNVDKVKRFCAKTIFSKKEITMKLSDFVILLNRTFEIIFPFDIISKITEDNTSKSSKDDADIVETEAELEEINNKKSKTSKIKIVEPIESVFVGKVECIEE
jgi:hypothetical protein